MRVVFTIGLIMALSGLALRPREAAAQYGGPPGCNQGVGVCNVYGCTAETPYTVPPGFCIGAPMGRFASECVLVHTAVSNGSGTQWRQAPFRVVCVTPSGAELTTPYCGDLKFATVQFGACNQIYLGCANYMVEFCG